MGVTAHWISTNTLERGNCVLSCKRMNGKHSYDRIAELLQDTFNEYSLLREQIVSTVTDNGSNFIKAFKEFGYDIQDHNMTDDMDLVILTMKKGKKLYIFKLLQWMKMLKIMSRQYFFLVIYDVLATHLV
ncbi:uncharacterized protein LOC111042352 [Myzus persicae]|uniref:uncharacterized protein LOC111042352 n=1 Tax=Myzus persicae TaxID=13164 RepID=UPI000B931FA5|nr:uncharacterized protein LOC111042352 [Myzus persicae]